MLGRNPQVTIVLFEPQIPQNTGNIVRTCSVTGANLVLIKPLGFSTSNKRLKRAGLDYWEGVDVSYEESLWNFLAKQNDRSCFFFSSKGKVPYYGSTFAVDTTLIFGSETMGLPHQVFERWPEKVLTIPMINHARCLNLATSVGIVLYEVLRQRQSADSLC